MEGRVMDVYRPSQLPRYCNASNRWTRLRLNQPTELRGVICTVREVACAVISLVSTTEVPPPKEAPQCIFAVLQEWDCEWMWTSLWLWGDNNLLEESIRAGSCRAVTDGSYIRELCPDLCSTAFVFKCTEGRGILVGYFPEQSDVANAYRGEILGLMAIHLILLAVNRVDERLTGQVAIFSDCLRALKKVATLPATRISTNCRHSDILKNIMVNCSDLQIFTHQSPPGR